MEEKGQNFCLVQLKMIEAIKRFKGSKWWKLLGCRYLDFWFGHYGYKRYFACFVAKKMKDRSLVVIWKYQGKVLKFFFVFNIMYMLRGTNSRYLPVVPKAKSEVGSRPSHDATLTAGLHVAKT